MTQSTVRCAGMGIRVWWKRTARPTLWICSLVIIIAGSVGAVAQPGGVSDLLQQLHAPSATEPATLVRTEEGFLHFVAAPPAAYFRDQNASKSGDTETRAQQFVQRYGAAFGLAHTLTSLEGVQERSWHGKSFVHLRQRVQGFPVLGSTVTVQLDEQGVYSILSDVLRDPEVETLAGVGLAGTVPESSAQTAAITAVQRYLGNVHASLLSVEGNPELVVYAPSVLGLPGAPRLAWFVQVRANIVEQPTLRAVLVDARTAEILCQYSLLHDLKNRIVYDMNNSEQFPTQPTRVEGSAASGVPDVDNMYDFLGHTYEFYSTEHGRDSYDNKGSALRAFVRFPVLNAFWDPTQKVMIFGSGFAIDDVVAHELTHGVTQYTSNLIYLGESGAINESMSDIFGEFVDLTNGAGNDSPSVRWRVGEDLPADIQDQLEPGKVGIRNMKDPTEFGHPDRYKSPLFFPPDLVSVDNGGVHINSGVSNKLCYLLTDGDTFNGYTIRGLGISRVADLFYGAQLILSQSASFYDLYLALGAASIAMNMSFDDRLNVVNATRAVEIEPPSVELSGARGLRATPVRLRTNAPAIALTWQNPGTDLFSQVTLVRRLDRFPQTPHDGAVLLSGRDDHYLDTEILSGNTYYYTLFVDLLTGFPQTLHVKATAGQDTPNLLSEAFDGDPQTANRPATDLSYSQVLFSPTGAPSAPPGASAEGVSYDAYTASFVRGIRELPWNRDTVPGGANTFTFGDDQVLAITPESFSFVFPFFGKIYNSAVIGANGYIAFLPVSAEAEENFPSLAAHFAVPRISFFFSNLAPSGAGEVWGASLPDRAVLTFENVPAYSDLGEGSEGTVTVQVELFTSGHIRITWLTVGISNAVVGLSDGRGVMPDLPSLFPEIQPTPAPSTILNLPPQPQRLTLVPGSVPTLRVRAGERAEFLARTVLPPNALGPITLWAEWNVPGAVPFADRGDGTGLFSWQTRPEDAGQYIVRVRARVGVDEAFADAIITVDENPPLPQSINLRLSTTNPLEDPSADRTVGDDQPLTAAYEYFHPWAATRPEFAEGATVLYWVRNGSVVAPFINQRTVPASATAPGDTWYFVVIPATEGGLLGASAFSPVVTVVSSARLLSVSPPYGLTAGGTVVRITGDRLIGVIAVKFGGVSAAGFRAISAQEIEVQTPPNRVGSVDVTVVTAEGSSTLRRAFTYVQSVKDIPRADVNKDGAIDAADVQAVLSAVLQGATTKSAVERPEDIDLDGRVTAADIQLVVNAALFRN